jgi:uncharacterized protein YfaS (alpha-2-macroglobulin family)
MPRRSPSLVPLGLLAVALAGCSWFSSQEDPDPGEREWTGDATASGDTASDDPEAPITAASLRPTGAAIGDAGAAPREVAFHLARAVFPGAAVGGAPPAGTTLTVTPEVPGAVVVRSPSSIAFVPTDGFAPGASYDVKLASVATRDGVLPLDGEGATVRVQAPAFGFVRMVPTRTAAEARRRDGLEVQLVFSGPIDPASTASRVRITHSVLGDVTSSGRFSVSDSSPNRLSFTLRGLATERAGELVATVAPGVASALDGASAPAGEGRFAFDPSGPSFKVLAAHLVEGTNGFAVEIVCDDEASNGYKRWHWFDHLGDSFRTSPRCLPTEESARDFITVSPPVPFTVVQSRGGFRLQGAFPRGALQIELAAGLTTVDGGALGEQRVETFTVPQLSPSVSFAASGRYLPRGAWKSLGVQHRNVEELRVVVRHVPERNLVFWLTGESEAASSRVADKIVDQSVPVRGDIDERATTWLDLATMVPDAGPGVYEVEISGGGAEDTRRLLMTDTALVVKGGAPGDGGKLRVWALDVHTGAQLGGVAVQAILPSGKQVGTCTTGQDGCVVPIARGELDEEAPVALLARRGSDVTYLKFSDLQADLSDYKVQGQAYASEVPYRASLWTERGVFRPGETAHVAGVVRDAERVAPPRNMPVDVQIYDPRNQLLRTLAVRLNGAGMFEVSVPLADFARTGRYRVVATAGGAPIGEVGFGVEEFVPERMAVEAKIDGKAFGLSDAVPVSAEARYLFGGSAAGHDVELTCRIEPAVFAPEGMVGYTFGDAAKPGRPRDLGGVTGTLDDDGRGVLACPPATSVGGLGGGIGPSTLVADVAVFEAGSGRTTQRRVSVPVHPTEHYVGLQVAAPVIEAGTPTKIDGVVVDWAGKPAAGVSEVEIELVQVDTEWGYLIDEDEGFERWGRVQRPVSLGRQKVKVQGGRFSTTVAPAADAGLFRVVAHLGDGRTSVDVQGKERWWWWGDEEAEADATPRPLKPTGLDLEVPEAIEVGGEASVSFVAPYKGRVLLTVETDQVLRSEWIRVDAGPASWKFTLGEYVDNVYVSALLIKDPHLESAEAFLPDRAFGVKSVRVRPTAYVGELTVSAPKEVRSNDKLAIDVDLGKGKGPRYVTVAAVDEGILSLTNFESPDPTKALFPTRALGVRTWETIGWALHLPAAGASRTTGGDGDGGMPGRVQMVKPVSLWSGLVEVGEDGKARVEFDVPQYRGKLRVMAVAGGRSKVAHAETTVLVRDPLVVQTTVPRVLVQGDRAEIPVFLTNTSGRRRDVTVSLDAGLLAEAGTELSELGLEAVKFEGARSASFTLDDGASRTVVFRVRTHLPAGALRFEAKAVSDDLTVGETLEVPVEPVGPRSRTSQLVALDGGALDVAGLVGGWVPGSERTTLWVTTNPYGQSFAHLSYVVRYPYGCIEQTSSTLRPLLYAGSLLQTADPALAASAPIPDMIAKGVDRLFSMQTSQGGFAYWQGGTTPTGWGTAYATHVLLDARDAGHAVPEKPLNDAIDWLVRSIDGRSDLEDMHGGTPGGKAYAHYVLARAGHGNVGAMQSQLDGITGTSGADLEARYLLMAGLYLAGDRRYEAQLRKVDASPITRERRNDWSYYSDLRRRGFVLSIYADLFGDGGAEPLARRVADALADGRSSRGYTTQELAWGLSGLGKVVKSGTRDYDAKLMAGARTVKPDAWGGGGAGDVLSWSVVRASEVGPLDLRVDKRGAGKLYAVVQSEGVREGATWTFGGQGLTVSREHLDPQGRTINLDDVGLGDLIVVRATVRNTSGERQQNLALVDRVPAGFEIENTRLGRGLAPDWVDADAAWAVENVNVRDDRVEVFGTLEAGQEVQVTYTVRAVTAGTFTLPPVEVDAMYDPSLWARAPGGTVRIGGPWAGFYL